MWLDRHDISPLAVIVLFGFAIPFAVWFGLATHKQIVRDLYNVGTVFALVALGFTLFIGFLAIRARLREQRLLLRRGEQNASDFAAMFASETEYRAANLLFPLLQSMTATGRLPRLQRDTDLSGEPLYLCHEDLADELAQLCTTLDICTAIDKDNEAALFGSTNLGQIVSALARFVEAQNTLTPDAEHENRE